jgi:hypothetical protein
MTLPTLPYMSPGGALRDSATMMRRSYPNAPPGQRIADRLELPPDPLVHLGFQPPRIEIRRVQPCAEVGCVDRNRAAGFPESLDHPADLATTLLDLDHQPEQSLLELVQLRRQPTTTQISDQLDHRPQRLLMAFMRQDDVDLIATSTVHQ